ncbi:MAG TPA: O-antigen ligase family protein [Bacteroidales bacterium]|nr:O-antigen ligase family protein [Bacteroidales bacterium]
MQIASLQHKLPAWFWVISLTFIAINGVLIAFEFFYWPLLSVGLMFFLLAFVRLDLVLLSVVLFAPVSIQLSELYEGGTAIDMYLPTEPLLALILLVYILRYLKGHRTDIRILRHPVTLSIYFYLAWMVITIITSSNPVVSLKFFISRLWFIVGFYMLAVEMFVNRKVMKRYVWLYIVSFSIVIIYTLVRHSAYGFDNQMMAHSMMQPFFKDHTSYGATLAMLLPVIIGFLAIAKRGDWNSRVLIALLLIFFITATVFSYTRAAWVSLLGGFMVWLAIRLRIRIEIIGLIAVGLIVAFFMFKPMIMLQLEKNSQSSSGDLAEHVQSISNISNDQSNLERINRWSCAIRMWQERPVFGFGPGTYQFEYARFQRSYQRTRISTNFGDRGTAHSEYLGPLSESGLLGMISVILIVIMTIYTGIKVHINARSRYIKIFSLAVLIGIITYYIHGVLNNFLDTDKASALFWGYTAMLVAMDLFHVYKKEDVTVIKESET